MSILRPLIKAYFPREYKILLKISVCLFVLFVIPSIFWRGDSLGDYDILNESEISALERSLKYFSPEDVSTEECRYNESGEEYLFFINDEIYFSVYPVENGNEFSYQEEYSRSWESIPEMLLGNIKYKNSVTIKSEYWSITAYELTGKKHSYAIKDYFYEIFDIAAYIS